MVTQESGVECSPSPKSQESVIIRRQIGASKKRVEDCHKEVQKQTVIDFQKFLKKLHEDLQKLQKRCQTLEDWDRKWKNLMVEDSTGKEKNNQKTYVDEYGNYLETLEDGKKRIQDLNDLYDGLNRMRLLDENTLILLSTLGEPSKEGAQQEEQKVISKNPPVEIQPAEQLMDKRTDDKLGAVQAVPILDDNGEEHLATVFFHLGSNTSYIRKEFAKRLKLNVKKLNVDTFAHRETKKLLTTTFDVRFKTKDLTATVQLCSVDNIASNIVTAEVESDVLKRLLQDQDQYLQLKRTREEVDILIGLGSYLEILGQVNTLRLANGLQLHITDVGPIVAGKENVVDFALTFSAL